MKREYIASSSGQERTVVIEGVPRNGQVAVTVDGKAMAVDAVQIRRGTWSIIVEHCSYVVDLDPRRTGTAVSVGGSDAQVLLEDAAQRRLAAAARRGGSETIRGETIRAPIAGKLVKYAVAVGDSVAAGQAVVVLEAMKMENEITAERGGTVAHITRQPGQPVDTGDVLLELV